MENIITIHIFHNHHMIINKSYFYIVHINDGYDT